MRRVAALLALAAVLLAVALIASGGGSPSTASLLRQACSQVSHYDENAVVRTASGLAAGYAACAAPGERPVVDSWRILSTDPGSGATVSWY